MNNCEWIHRKLEELPIMKYPFDLIKLPLNGIYFFYEEGENNTFNGKNRIVRVGTHKNNNFRTRINDHFLFNERKMNFNEMKPAPKDRSIFRKNLGRAIIKRDSDNYMHIWNIDFTTRKNRELYGYRRDIEKEKALELQITEILRNNFSFRFIIVDELVDRMGGEGLESSLIGTVAYCPSCKPSLTWLGKFHPNKEIQQSGLWQIQNLNSPPINEEEKEKIEYAIIRTKEWMNDIK